ncbi:ABC transporter substrate-binding protein [Embleya sp. NBC_00896]|uniref:ABC transporter substrate-binding protein n=1 Tax=Embleya sp. NBC_00896 TaxID=2975961 RepID=UPI003863CBDA|nr:ABC transporter substrate-binding protein [Embleya sp. NBC_00896]
MRSVLPRQAALVAAMTGLTLTTVACGSDSAAGSSGHGSMTVLVTQEARSLDPTVASLSQITGGTQAAAVFDVLLWIDPKTGRAEPQLAERATAAEGGRVWTLRLKPDLKFSDGTPLDAEAVKFNWARHADPANRSMQARVVAGLDVAVTDNRTLAITLPAPNAHFDKVIAHNLAFIGSPTAIKADPKGFGNKPVGAGPYKVKSWVRDQQLVLERNPRYWQPGGRPPLKELILKPVVDQSQRLAMLNANQAHVLTTAQAKLMGDAQKAGLPVATEGKNGGFMTLFNTSRPPFDDPRARRAYALIMDPVDRAKVVTANAGKPLSTFLRPGTEFTAADAVLPANNRAEAQRLLDQLAAEGKPLSFTYSTYNSPGSHLTAEYWLAQVATMKNITMKTEFLEGTQYLQKVQIQRQFEAGEFVLSFDDPEPVLYNFLHSKGQDNHMQWKSPAVDQALDQARAGTDAQARKAAYALVQRELAKDVPLFAYEQAFTAAIQAKDAKVTGLTVFEDGLIMFDRLGLA